MSLPVCVLSFSNECVFLSSQSERLTDLTCHGGHDAEEEDSGSSVIWPYLAIASSLPSPSSLSDGLSMVLLLHAETHTQTHKYTTHTSTRS